MTGRQFGVPVAPSRYFFPREHEVCLPRARLPVVNPSAEDLSAWCVREQRPGRTHLCLLRGATQENPGKLVGAGALTFRRHKAPAVASGGYSSS